MIAIYVLARLFEGVPIKGNTRKGKVFLGHSHDSCDFCSSCFLTFDLIALVFNVALIIRWDSPLIDVFCAKKWIWCDDVIEIDFSVRKFEFAPFLFCKYVSSARKTNPHANAFVLDGMRTDQNSALTFKIFCRADPAAFLIELFAVGIRKAVS